MLDTTIISISFKLFKHEEVPSMNARQDEFILNRKKFLKKKLITLKEKLTTCSKLTSISSKACDISTIPSSPTGDGAFFPPIILGAINAKTCRPYKLLLYRYTYYIIKSSQEKTDTKGYLGSRQKRHI